MKISLFLLLGGALFYALDAVAVAKTRFSGASPGLYNLTLTGVTLLTSSKEEAVLQQEIRNQLRYLVGQLHSLDISPAFGRSLKVTLDKTETINETSNQITYHVEMEGGALERPGWPTAKKIAVYLPKGGEATLLAKFNQTFTSCGANGPSILWYDIDPRKSGCKLKTSPADVHTAEVILTRSTKNTKGKSPEYEKIWEDKTLVITAVRGNTTMRPRDDALLDAHYGTPISSRELRSATHKTTINEYNSASGKVILRLMYIDEGNVQTVGPDFESEFRGYLKDSDVVAYNGHSGLGANVQAFTALATLEPKRYYLYWMNSCVTYVYLDEALFEASRKANAGSDASKYLDVMTAVGLGAFAGGRDLTKIIDGLVGKRTYGDILGSLSVYGYPAVQGEEDNAWPAAFKH